MERSKRVACVDISVVDNSVGEEGSATGSVVALTESAKRDGSSASFFADADALDASALDVTAAAACVDIEVYNFKALLYMDNFSSAETAPAGDDGSVDGAGAEDSTDRDTATGSTTVGSPVGLVGHTSMLGKTIVERVGAVGVDTTAAASNLLASVSARAFVSALVLALAATVALA